MTIDWSGVRTPTFDCDGTIVDWETGIAEALAVVLTRHGVTIDREAALLAFAAHEHAVEEERATFGGSVWDGPAFADSAAGLADLTC